MKTAFPGRADLSSVRRIGNDQAARWGHTRPTHFRGYQPSPSNAARFFAGLAVLYYTFHCEAAVPCGELITFADGKAPTREIFLSPEGNDSSGHGTESAPFRTLGRAIQGVTPGTAIRLLPGTYGGGNHVRGIAGTAEAPVWIGGVPGRTRPVISGGSTALQLSRVRYLVVEGLEIASSTGNGINCDDGGQFADPEATRGVLFRDLRIRDIGTGGNNDCLKLSGVYDYWVIDSEFMRGSRGGSGIDHVGCHRGVIARCRFEDMGSNAIQCKGGSADIEIKWSHFKNAGARAINIGGATGFEYFRPPLSATEPNAEARRIRVVANVFEGSDAPVAYVGCVDCLVAHNTIVNPTRWVARILQETTSAGGYEFLPCSRSRFLNNVVYFSRTGLSTFINVGANTEASSFTFAHNLWFAHDEPNRSAPSLPVPETGGVVGLDPRFTGAATGDFTLLPGSPAMGKGLPLTEVPADRSQRCYADPRSIGAHEATPADARRRSADAGSD